MAFSPIAPLGRPARAFGPGRIGDTLEGDRGPRYGVRSWYDPRRFALTLNVRHRGLVLLTSPGDLPLGPLLRQAVFFCNNQRHAAGHLIGGQR